MCSGQQPVFGSAAWLGFSGVKAAEGQAGQPLVGGQQAWSQQAWSQRRVSVESAYLRAGRVQHPGMYAF